MKKRKAVHYQPHWLWYRLWCIDSHRWWTWALTIDDWKKVTCKRCLKKGKRK